MGYIVYFDIAAICVMTVVLLSYGLGKRVGDKQGKIWLVMLGSNFISTVMDILCVWLTEKQIFEARELLYVFNYIFFVTHIITAVAFFVYCRCLVEKMEVKFGGIQLLLAIPLFAVIGTLILQLAKNIVFTIDEQLHYTRMPGITLLYFGYMFYILVGLVYLIRYKKLARKEIRGYCNMFVIICLISVIAQYLNPTIMIEPFGVAVCLLLFYLAMERPEEFIDSELDILNQRALLKTFQGKFQAGERFSSVMLKVHNLKALRQTMGIEAVSEFLKEIAEYLDKDCKHATVYHFSQSMFVLLPDKKATAMDIEHMIHKICKRFDESWGRDDMAARLRIHLAYMKFPNDAATMDIFMSYLQYMRSSSAENQNKVLAASDMNVEKRNRELRIRKILEDALENGGFEVFYQPIFSVEEKRIISAEALIRLKDQSLGYISPEEFIPIAEQSGTILRIGEYVFESVCRFLHEENLKEYGIKYIEINLSVVQCMQHNLVERLLDIMRKYQIDASQINLEITETAAIHSTEVLEANIHKLYEQGIQFSLDDYGSGYSNTDYLFHLPFKLVKIDKMILWEACKNEKAMIALRNTIQMIKELGLEIVVEGVETLENVEYLTAQKCDFLQGYYYSKPIPKQRFLALVQQINQ